MKKNVEQCCDWCDKKNYGIAHFGINPNLLPFSSIAFDNLHCRLSIVRSIQDCTRKYIQGCGYDINKKFTDILCLSIREYYVNCYEIGKSLAAMHGEQVDQFLELGPKIIGFLQEYLKETTKSRTIMKLLHMHPMIDSFMRMSKVKV